MCVCDFVYVYVSVAMCVYACCLLVCADLYLILQSVSICIEGYIKVGGYEKLHVRYMSAIPNTTLYNPNTTCGYPRNDSWYMLRDPLNSDMPWPGFLFGQTIASIWYFCADQVN